MSTSGVRPAIKPLVLFTVVSAAVFTLAELHLARPAPPHVAAGAPVQLGDEAHGRVLFTQKCAGCHGQNGEGTKIAPKLLNASISVAAAKAQIGAGGGVMPARLVTGRQESDVLAYLASILRAR